MILADTLAPVRLLESRNMCVMVSLCAKFKTSFDTTQNLLHQRERERERKRQTGRDRQRQAETERDRQRQTETDRDRQRQTETQKQTH